MNKKQFIDNQQSHMLKNDHNAQFRIDTEIQALQTILKYPIPWIGSKTMKHRHRQNDIQTNLASE